MLQLSDIQSSPEELQDYYAQLRAQHVTPAWIGTGIGVEPQRRCRPGLSANTLTAATGRPSCSASATHRSCRLWASTGSRRGRSGGTCPDIGTRQAATADA
jgi:hypothetical protein